MVLTALTGEKLTAAILLGEERVDAKSKEKRANKDVERQLRKLRKLGVQPGKVLTVQDTGVTFQGDL